MRHHQRLEEDSVRVRAVLDSMGEGLIALDVDGMITTVNPYALKALGYAENELVGKWFNETIVAVDHHCEPLKPLDRPVVKALTSGQPVAEYAYYLRKDGSMMPVYLSVAPVVIDGRPSGVIEVFRDVTADRQLDLAKDEFVSLASHQLRTPATGVKAILSMVLSGDFGELTERQRHYLQRAFDGNNRQIQIIDDILNAARIDSGKMELELEQVELISTVSDVITELSAEFNRHNQRIQLVAPTELTLWADSSKIRMALDNLIGNASKYTPDEGNVTVTIVRDEGMVRVSITDTGVGIAPSDLPKLFTKFTRIDNDLTDKVGGTGLGLYLAHSIAELHKGSLSVDSAVGQGSTFHLSLPTRLTAR